MKALFFPLLLILSACGTLHVQIHIVDPGSTATSAFYTTDSAACPNAFFFGSLPDRCPDDAASTLKAAFQMFDGGYMLWEGGSSSVYILYNDGAYISIEGQVIETWAEVDVKELPPPHHFKPMRGFSRVWMHEADIRDRLGWPFGIEQAFTTPFQRSTDASGAVTIYMTLPNTQVIEFNPEGTWQVVR